MFRAVTVTFENILEHILNVTLEQLDSSGVNLYLLAVNPYTLPEVCTVLATHPDQHVTRVLATNTAVSENILESLYGPDLTTCVNLAANPSISFSLLTRLFEESVKNRNSAVLRAVSANSKVSLNMLETLVQYDDPAISLNIATSSLASHDLLMVLLKRPCNQVTYHYIEATLNNPNFDISIIEQLIPNLEDNTRVLLAVNKRVSSGVLETLALYVSQRVRSYVAANPNTPSHVLTQLSVDPDFVIKEEVAKNFNTTPETLTVLASDSLPVVVRAVARNPNTPIAVLERLCATKDRHLMANLASNPSLPPDKLDLLARSHDHEVANAAFTNPNISPETLSKWAIEGMYGTQLVASPGYPADKLADAVLEETVSSFVKKAAINNPNFPHHKLLAIMKTNILADKIRVEAFKKLDLTTEEITKLCHTLLPSPDFHTALAAHPNTHPDILATLHTPTAINETLTALATNPNTPTHTLAHLTHPNQPAHTQATLNLIKQLQTKTQTELIELCELTNNTTKNQIKYTTKTTHPLLHKILNPSTKTIQQAPVKTF